MYEEIEIEHRNEDGSVQEQVSYPLFWLNKGLQNKKGSVALGKQILAPNLTLGNEEISTSHSS